MGRPRRRIKDRVSTGQSTVFVTVPGGCSGQEPRSKACANVVPDCAKICEGQNREIRQGSTRYLSVTPPHADCFTRTSCLSDVPDTYYEMGSWLYSDFGSSGGEVFLYSCLQLLPSLFHELDSRLGCRPSIVLPSRHTSMISWERQHIARSFRCTIQYYSWI